MPTSVKNLPNSASDEARRSVVVVATDGLGTFEFGIAIEVFGLPRPELEAWYTFLVCGGKAGPLHATGGIGVSTNTGIEALKGAHTIIVPSWRNPTEKPPAELTKALQDAYASGSRVVSICTGAFVLAAAGILSGKRATTHWRHTDTLAAQFPDIQVEHNVLYVDEEDVLTSAGSAAGIDLCLHIVRKDFGPKIANHIAKRLVVAPHREGGQAQFVEQPVPNSRSSLLGPLLESLRRRLQQRHSIASLASEARMSERSFARRFHAATGLTPTEWILNERLQLARELLETSSTAIEDLAHHCGFGSPASFRHHFRTKLGISPAAYRRRFFGPS